MEKRKIRKIVLIKPLGVCLAGIAIWAICTPLTQSVNIGALIGILLLMAGTLYFAYELYKEIFRSGIEMPMLLDNLFPNYPIVEDRDDLERHISGFRSAMNDYFSTEGNIVNSKLQMHSSQLFWHSMYLWKNRMDKKCINLTLESNRRAYTSKKNSVRQENYFDGRYNVNDVYEEIDATRSFYYKGRVIKTICNREVAHYTLLSAKETDNGKLICPNCGGQETRENLIDGCDYCGTKFTVEDINNSVGAFAFRRDFAVSESKREAVRKVVYPWVFVITEMPFVYFGFFGAFMYMTESLIARIATGLLAAGLFGLLGYCFVKVNMLIVLPFVVAKDKATAKVNRIIIYRPEEALDAEKKMAEYVRQFDSKFSVQNFFSGIQNKLYAIHFADRAEQINAFSEMDLSHLLTGYENIIDIDLLDIKLTSYNLLEGNIKVPDGSQNASVMVKLLLREFCEGKINDRIENIEMHLTKSGRCRTQAVCAPSLMKCEKCGGPFSLLDGKSCVYCGNELELRKYDWVITYYKVF